MEPRAKSLRNAPLDLLREVLATQLADEGGILERLAAEVAKGHAHDDLWTMLHEAAQRDDRTADLAFAYERICQPKGLRVLPPAAQADVLVHSADFFADVFGDSDGAVGYLERALATVPAHARAFERLERVLVERSDGAKLCELYAKAASQRTDRAEQLRLLRRAAELSDVYAEDAARVAPIYEQILRVDPDDAAARRALEGWYARAGRHADVAKLFEQALARGLDAAEAKRVRFRLVEIYVAQLKQAERAVAHVEEILREEPANAGARKVAKDLLASKVVGARVAEALEIAHEKLGETTDQARMLEVQIEQHRGPKRVAAQRRLAKLRFLVEPDATALALLE